MPRSRQARGVKAPDPISIRTLVPPSATPADRVVTLAQFKLYAKIDSTAEDSEIEGMLLAAEKWAEEYLRRSLLTQQWRITYDSTPFDFFTIPDTPRLVELPRPPIVTLDKIETTSEAGVDTVFALTNVITDIRSEPGRVVLKPGAVWPSGLQLIDAVRFEYTAGYGAAAAVPETIKTAIKRIVLMWFDNRSDISCKPANGVPEHIIPASIWQILQPFRIMQL